MDVGIRGDRIVAIGQIDEPASRVIDADGLVIAPGFIETDMTTALGEDVKSKTLQSIALGRAGSTDDVADVALFLASDLSRYVTGQVIGVDGGMVI